jgi:hypothetical protein
MKWLGISVAIVAAVGGYLYYLYLQNSFTFSYRYRLQLTLSVDEKMYTGSGVVEVVWRCGRSYGNKHDELGPCYPSLGGQAALIDLGSRGVVVATLHTGEHVNPVPDGVVSAVWLCAFAFGNQSASEDDLTSLRSLTGRRDLVPSNFPRLVWFPNPTDPNSATKVTPQSVAGFIDPTAHFTEAFVEITKDPVVVDIPNKLPWFSELQRKQKAGQDLFSKPGEFRLVHNMFVGENS